MSASEKDEWFNSILKPAPGISSGFKRDKFGILNYFIEESESLFFQNKFSKGAFLRQLKDVKNHQINWETPYYFKLLDDYFIDYTLGDKTFLDFGCGDGRFTEYLIERGAKKIICVDIDYRSLVSLSEYVKNMGYEKYVTLIHADLENLNFVDCSIDCIVAIRSLYYLNEKYEIGIKKFNSILKTNGLLIIGDPDLEGFIYTSIFFNTLEDALLTYETSRFLETKDKNSPRFRAFTESESIKIFAEAGFKIINKHSITMLHKILRILLLRNQIQESEIDANWSRIKALFDFMDTNGKLSKDILWKLEKENV